MSSIPLPALGVRPPEQQPGPLEQYGKILQLKNLQAQQQMMPLQSQAMQQENQQRQMALNDQQAASAAMHEWDGKDINALPPLILKHGGSANAVFGMKNQILDYQTKLQSMTKDELANVKTKNDYFAQSIDNVKALPPDQQAQAFEAAKADAVQRGYLDPQQAQGMSYQGPDQLDTLEKSFLGHGAVIENALKQQQGAEAEARAKEAQATTEKTQIETQQLKEFGGTNSALADSRYRNILMNKQLGRPVSQDDEAFLNAYQKQKTLVPQFNFNMQMQGVGNAPLNSKQEATRDAILEGRMTPPSSFALKTPYWQNIMGAVFEKDPQFSEQRAELRKGFTVGSQSKEINDINTAMAHAGVLGDAIDNLNNTNMLVWNRFANAVGVQVGKDPVTTFNTIVHRLAPELAAAYGQNTGGERDKVEGDLQASLGPTQLKKNLGATVGLIRGKIGSFENQWNQNKSDTMPSFQDRFIMPAAKQTLDKWAPQGQGGGGIQVSDPRGIVHTFPDQKSADAFKKAAGIQ